MNIHIHVCISIQVINILSIPTVTIIIITIGIVIISVETLNETFNFLLGHLVLISKTSAPSCLYTFLGYSDHLSGLARGFLIVLVRGAPFLVICGDSYIRFVKFYVTYVLFAS